MFVVYQVVAYSVCCIEGYRLIGFVANRVCHLIVFYRFCHLIGFVAYRVCRLIVFVANRVCHLKGVSSLIGCVDYRVCCSAMKSFLLLLLPGILPFSTQPRRNKKDRERRDLKEIIA